MWTGIIASVAKGFAYLTGFFYNKQQIDAGAAEQASAAQVAQTKREQDGQTVTNTVNSDSDSAVDKLRDKWTRPSGS